MIWKCRPQNGVHIASASIWHWKNLSTPKPKQSKTRAPFTNTVYDKNPCAWFLWRGQLVLWKWRSVSKKPFKMGFCFYPTLKSKIQPINSLKNVSKVHDLFSTIAMTAHFFGALSQATGPFFIGQELDLLWFDWLNWWVCPWVPAFEIQIVRTS